MNLLHNNSLFLFLLLILFSAKGNAQVTATGRVTAEVVESVSASAKVFTGFDLKNSVNEEYGTLVESNLNLGTVTVHSGTNVTCVVVMQRASLVNKLGNRIKIETAFTARTKKEDPGSKTLHLNAKAWARSGQDSGIYKGSYEMVFAYN